jgi:anti-sigma regulatory factor (Ser/Thr protein kinase)
MIFNFTISGKENRIVEFEKELLEILKRLVDNHDMIAHEIHFCIHEAILNIIQHTYKWNLNLPIEIKLNVTGSMEKQNKVLEIRIKDNGPAIDKELIPPTKIDKFQMRKRGLYMIGKIMDEFHVEPIAKNGNITYMKKHLTMKTDEMLDLANGK